MTKRAALYLRQSKSDDQGIDRQRELTTKLAESRQWTIAGVYQDDGVSASKVRGNGTAWDRLLADADAGTVEVVVAVDLDRLLRSTRDLNVLIDHGLGVITVNGEIDLTTADGELRASMLASIARFEVRRKGERQTRANAQRAAQGAVPKGVRLTGYEVDGTVKAAEAAAVRQVFEGFAAGESLKGLARLLTERGVLPRRAVRAGDAATDADAVWNPSSVRTMLMNPRYAGRAVYRGEVLTGQRGMWEAIVSEPLFDAAQARLTDPRRITNRLGTERKHLGSGLYMCGACGSPMITNGPRYWCRGHVTRSMGQVDAFVLEVARRRLRMPDAAGMLARDTDENEGLAVEVENLRGRLRRVEDDYDAGLIDGRRFAVASEKVRAELAAVEAQRAKLLGDTALAAVLTTPDPVAAFDSGTLAARRSVIDAMFEVTLLSSPRGSRTFDPETVQIDWKVV